MRKTIGPKGVSPMIATVLLIFFAMALGAVIMNWGSSYSKLQEDIEKKQEEAKIKCEKFVAIEMANETATDLCVIQTKKTLKMKLINKGSITIDGIRAVMIGKDYETDFFDLEGIALTANEARQFSQEFDQERLGRISTLEITPKISMNIEGKLYSCSQTLEVKDIKFC
ncbi:hypothetical protein COV93_06750 [Candidatus Woesearchaeota archaeon CG11_big_fil_rev_8_21_14_0_20_43_8]|nr:MAG: hypothetical protein COV93_06750 [Candidatus Woesearchaeota archaeon CG11_big_fil_rev_8_21_14_0_20_43_8]PIO04963.1 MAG: hypothetical protein COT47_06780 [Candidatus Woesearchaeota archaeon CG08_land_8_20_14_0_20_43_7]